MFSASPFLGVFYSFSTRVTVVYSKIKHPPSSRVSPTAVPPLHTLREPTASASRGATLGSRIDRGISLIMSLRFVRQLRTQTAQSLVLIVKLGAPFSSRLAARVPSANKHIPFISTGSAQPQSFFERITASDATARQLIYAK